MDTNFTKATYKINQEENMHNYVMIFASAVIIGSFVIKDRRKTETVRIVCSLVIFFIAIWNLFSGH